MRRVTGNIQVATFNPQHELDQRFLVVIRGCTFEVQSNVLGRAMYFLALITLIGLAVLFGLWTGA